MRCLTFDIETVPDTDLGRRLHGLEGLPDEEVAKAMVFHHQQETGSDFLPLHMHRVVAIGVAWRHRDSFTVRCLGDESSSEQELVTKFFEVIDSHTPDLVSWNGAGFDLPVLHYRALLHGVRAPRYWEVGDEDTSFRYNNYLGRFHWRHTDLMDVLSGYQGRSRASLDSVAVLLGLPGKGEDSGSQVWDRYLAGDLAGIRHYCESDVLNTYLVWLRFQAMRGILDDAALEAELSRVRRFVDDATAAHWQRFGAAWAWQPRAT
jgi:predicted PolB exonuclease-like 3'-5' exonuclease